MSELETEIRESRKVRGWHVGSNVPGYLPESEPWHTDSWVLAVESLKDEIATWTDHYLEEEEGESSEIARDYLDAIEEISSLLAKGTEEEVSFLLPSSDSEWDLGVVYWVLPCEEEECQGEEE